MRRVLTGFSGHIGDQLTSLQGCRRGDRFLMGFEESYGYLVGTHARDKDAIVATMLYAEMASWYVARNMDLRGYGCSTSATAISMALLTLLIQVLRVLQRWLRS